MARAIKLSGIGESTPASDSAPGLHWLALGAVLGLVAAAFGLLERDDAHGELPASAVARVNDGLIDGRVFDRAIAQREAAYDRELTREERARLLEQMIDEELLLQRGIELGMVNSESTVRSAVVQSLIASVTAEADAAEADDQTLQRFLEAHAERYTYASAMRIDAWTSDDEQAARRFLAALQEGDDAVPPDGVRSVPGLPQGAAPLARLRMFVGPAIAAAAADMPVGGSAVFARQGRWYVVRVAARASSTLAELDTVRSQVLLDYRRSLADQRLRDYLDELRSRSDVRVVMPE